MKIVFVTSQLYKDAGLCVKNHFPVAPALPLTVQCVFVGQSGVCGCEKGYTEVMTTHGFLDYCTKTPGGDNKKADVKTNSGRLKPGPSQIQDFFGEWSLRPVGPGNLKCRWQPCYCISQGPC